MEQFNIEVTVNHVKSINMWMEPGENVMDVAKNLSIVYAGKIVKVCMFARIRRSYKDGAIISSRPDLKEFYDNPSKQDEWDWSCCGKATD